MREVAETRLRILSLPPGGPHHLRQVAPPLWALEFLCLCKMGGTVPASLDS